jgi:hypothetical protein
MVDEEKLRTLATRRNLSESEAVRQAVNNELGLDDAMAAWDEVVAIGGLADPDNLLDRE